MVFPFSHYLKSHRGQKTCAQIAREVGISRATWNRLERGYPPDVRTLIKLHEGLGTGYDLLMAYYVHDFLTDEALATYGPDAHQISDHSA